MIRLEDGFYAVENTCHHAGCRLSFYGGVRKDKKIVCTRHGAVFDLKDGAIIEGPAQSPLKVYSLRVANVELRVEL